MRTLTEKYNGVLKGIFSKDQFLRDARMEQSNLITQHNSYSDAINILLNKGLISEVLNQAGRFAKAKSEAMKLSREEGRIKYVDRGPDETFVVSNSYDPEKTVVSFKDGQFLAGDELLNESTGAERFLDNQTIEYRGCIIEPGSYGGFEWRRPGWVDSKDDGGYMWTGSGDTVEQCKDQIDDSYNEYGEVREDIAESAGAEIFLDNLFKIAQEELKAGRITEAEFDYVLNQIEIKEYDILELGDDPTQVLNKLVMQAQSQRSISTIDEGPAKNNPKIEKLVAGINDLIAKAVDSDGDPIGVVDPTSTWEEPYVYEPIQYKNGQLKIVSKSPYQKAADVDIILSRDMEFDGIPTLRLIMRMYKKAIKQAGRVSNQDPEITEAGNNVKAKYLEIVSYFNNVARSISPQESYELHNMLKDYFNRMFEGTIEEASTTVERNDELEHIHSGLTFRVSTSGKTRISGPVTKAGKYRGTDYRVHDLIQIKPILVGAEWKKLPAAKPEVKYANLAEAKEEGYQSPKPELPLDVLQHAIRFELEKKKVEGEPKVYRFTEEEYLKAHKAAVKNLEKDLMYYKKEEGTVEGASSKSDEMVKVKLKESFKKIIRNILSENASEKKAFDLNGKPL